MRAVAARSHLLLRCTGALQGPPMKLLWFKGAVGGRLFTAISHGRIGDVVKNGSQPRAGGGEGSQPRAGGGALVLKALWSGGLRFSSALGADT